MPFVIKGALMKRARHSRNLERRGRKEDKEAKNKERSFQMHLDAEHAHLAPKYKSPEATIRREMRGEMALALILAPPIHPDRRGRAAPGREFDYGTCGDWQARVKGAFSEIHLISTVMVTS